MGLLNWMISMIGGCLMQLVVHALRAALFLPGLWQFVAHLSRCGGRRRCEEAAQLQGWPRCSRSAAGAASCQLQGWRNSLARSYATASPVLACRAARRLDELMQQLERAAAVVGDKELAGECMFCLLLPRVLLINAPCACR